MLSKQEMFDRAVRGLHSQNWEQCRDQYGCQYRRGDRHCAWGWVDPDQDNCHFGVSGLRSNRSGLAAQIAAEDQEFAEQLQHAHDTGANPQLMKQKFQALGERHFLTWPSDVPKP